MIDLSLSTESWRSMPIMSDQPSSDRSINFLHSCHFSFCRGATSRTTQWVRLAMLSAPATSRGGHHGRYKYPGKQSAVLNEKFKSASSCKVVAKPELAWAYPRCTAVSLVCTGASLPFYGHRNGRSEPVKHV